MKDKKIKYFVVSLPRTGTSTICKMSEIVGKKWSHAPVSRYENLIKNSSKNFFSDTPIFNPNVIREIISYEDIDSKFIFIDRDFNQVYNSWVNCGLYRNYSMMYNKSINDINMSNSQKFDFKNYNESFLNKRLNEKTYKKVFETHKSTVINLVKDNNKDLLIYRLNEGWDKFCDFLEVSIPDKEIPWLNKGKMFDKI